MIGRHEDFDGTTALASSRPHIFSLANRACADYRLDEAIYPASQQPMHPHLHPFLSLVLNGSFLETIGSVSYLREAGSIIFHPPHESHAVTFPGETHIISVHMGFQKWRALLGGLTLRSTYAAGAAEFQRPMDEEFKRIVRSRSSIDESTIDDLVLEILHVAPDQMLEQIDDGPDWYMWVLDYLHDNFARQISLSQLAAIGGVHRDHLSRTFRQKTGHTVGRYLRLLRAESAWRQVVSTETGLSEIAINAGFADQSHLSRTFQSSFGTTPSKCRKTYPGRARHNVGSVQD